jgi:hypothetical protein
MTRLQAIIVLMSLLTPSVFCGEDGTSGDDGNFMTLKADCGRPDQIVVTLRTSEPFEGLLYSRNHASRCGVAGVGGSNPVTTLVMEQECDLPILSIRQLTYFFSMRRSAIFYTDLFLAVFS